MNNEHELIETLRRNLKEIAVAVGRGQASKIHAIKAWRAATGATLKDSKDFIATFDEVIEQSVTDSISALERRVSRLEQRGNGS